jgi:ABC-type protease/lipase transport system fused ATPase/permease subunit
MDLVWLVYVISLLSGLHGLLGAFIVVSVCTMIALLIYRAAECSEASYYSAAENTKRVANGVWAMGHVKTAFAVFIVSAIGATLLPSEKTAYMMVGAYATQKVAENEKVQSAGGKVLNIINQKLDEYIDEGVAEAEKKAKRLKKD